MLVLLMCCISCNLKMMQFNTWHMVTLLLYADLTNHINEHCSWEQIYGFYKKINQLSLFLLNTVLYIILIDLQHYCKSSTIDKFLCFAYELKWEYFFVLFLLNLFFIFYRWTNQKVIISNTANIQNICSIEEGNLEGYNW